ncbi:hypothetical protein B5F77_02730 [Parabacteroides sp. An277]|nr:hypothetical protein B5F77_02730 [Parabacteroides sp. An277]
MDIKESSKRASMHSCAVEAKRGLQPHKGLVFPLGIWVCSIMGICVAFPIFCSRMTWEQGIKKEAHSPEEASH